MLSWARHPDQVFYEIAGDALDLTRALLAERNPAQDPNATLRRAGRREQLRWFRATMPRSARLFTPVEMLSLLQRLADAHRDKAALYRCTDYHWLVLYESLGSFIEIHNDAAADEKTRAGTVGSYKIGQIDFDELVGAFFHDTDFLLDTLADAAEDVKRLLGVNRETWGLVAGLKPHADEIELKPRADMGNPLFLPRPGPRTRRLATYPPRQLSVRTEWYFGEGAAADSKAITAKEGRRR